ncbi:Putative ZZ-type zinc finger-containing protein [Septoria linicola]|uniref:ZZ-type zinc finger-containing protein n=1 Tax=Septoria linicola TaxID=215465 RepID=A0A9Q9AEQ5_9PEZI|nr:Putative ZZ-type zinc finger-containing protein [Septoria linicola]
MPVESVRPAHDIDSATNNAYTYNAFADDYRHDAAQHHSTHGGSSSPVAPAYSPITPKVQPVLPAYSAPTSSWPEDGGAFTFAPPVAHHQQSDPYHRVVSQQPEKEQQKQHASASTTQPVQPSLQSSRIPPTEYIPQPPNLPFSGDDSGDAIALRAAISTLQFQKRKAQDDIKVLASIKQLALDDPKGFADELAAGRLSEQKPSLGDLRSILDNIEDGDDDDEVVLGATRDEEEQSQRAASLPAEIPDSQPSQLASQELKADSETGSHVRIPRIPGPQSVVRMPHVDWGKYGIAGEPLEHLHEQQRRWPGMLGPGDHKAREFSVAAPFSPWQDTLDDHQMQQGDGGRKDSGPTPSATGTISEHVMETRSRN